MKFLDLQKSYLELQSSIDENISQVLLSGQYVGGDFVEKFEQKWATYCDAKYAVGVGNGYDALVLSLRALDIGDGDEVLVPAHTFFATWAAIVQVGAIPIAVDVHSSTFNIDENLLAVHLTDKTKAVIAVHLYGQPANIGPILKFCRENSLFLIEDAAQSHGAMFEGKKIGSHGDLVCWSFYPGKNLGAFGDAGAITTNNKMLAETVRCLGNYGSKVKYEHDFLGGNSRLDPIQAAVLLPKLEYLDIWNSRRWNIATRYLEQLEDLPIELPFISSNINHVWHLFVIKSDSRDNLIDGLKLKGIETIIHYPRLPCQQKAFEYLDTNLQSIKNSIEITDKILSLPIGPHQSLEDTDFIIEAVIDYYRAA